MKFGEWVYENTFEIYFVCSGIAIIVVCMMYKMGAF